jgi:hypothetical protein
MVYDEAKSPYPAPKEDIVYDEAQLQEVTPALPPACAGIRRCCLRAAALCWLPLLVTPDAVPNARSSLCRL